MESVLQQKYKTAAQWTITNDILLAGEMGIESDTQLFKFGDGSTAWNSLKYAVAKGRTATITAAGSNATAEQKSWADAVCTGSASSYIDDVTIQTLIDKAIENGASSILLKAFGIFWIGNPIRIPPEVNFYVDGEGIPNVLFNISNAVNTPTAGTQFRSTPAWNTNPWYGTCSVNGTVVTKATGNFDFDENWVSQPVYINNVSYYVASVNASGGSLTLTESAGTQTEAVFWYSPSIFVRVKTNPSGGVINAIGQTRFENCALMPAWGTVSHSVAVYGLTDVYGANLKLDNFMFLPYGWLEAGQPQVNYADNPFMAFNCQGGNYGGGSDCSIGTIYIFAHGGSGPVWESIIGYDCVHIRKLMMFGCFRGILFQDAWLNEIDELVVYGSTGFAVGFDADNGRGNIIHRFNYESLNKGWMASNPLVYLCDGSYVQIDYFYNWPSYFSSNIVSITNDDSRIEKTCLAFNLGDSGIMQVIPRNVVIFSPFGGVISTPFSDGTYPAAGSTGSLSVPTSGVTYRIGSAVDITITGGTGVCITTKDAQGNIIDNAVSALTHRLLLGSMYYTNTYLNTGDYLTVTYTSAPAVTVIKATVGLEGSCALPASGVNYVAEKVGLDISFSGGTEVSATVSDGSDSTGGAILDSGLTSMIGYHLSPGQMINFGDFSETPSKLNVRRHSEP